MEQMYDIVAEVDKYNQFVPWCTQSSVTNTRPGFLNCKLQIGFPPIVERYSSAVTLSRPNLVKVNLLRAINFLTVFFTILTCLFIDLKLMTFQKLTFLLLPLHLK